jgi:hypothetical protein
MQACQQNNNYIIKCKLYTYVTSSVHNLSFSLNAPILDFVNKNDLNKFKSALKIQTLTLHTDSQQLLWTAETCWLLSIWSDVQAERMSWILVQHHVKMVMITDVSSMMLNSKNFNEHQWPLLFQHSSIPEDLTRDMEWRWILNTVTVKLLLPHTTITTSFVSWDISLASCYLSRTVHKQ